MNTITRAFLKRLREPSTWAGLGIMAAAFGLPSGTFELISQVGMGVAGLIAVALPENA